MSYIKDDLLREEVKRILTKKRRFHLIKEIQSTGEKFSYTQLANFLNENEVTIYDNLMYDNTSLLRYAPHPNFKFVKGDVREFGRLEKRLQYQP